VAGRVVGREAGFASAGFGLSEGYLDFRFSYTCGFVQEALV
jgi:hypothetical protein